MNAYPRTVNKVVLQGNWKELLDQIYYIPWVELKGDEFNHIAKTREQLLE